MIQKENLKVRADLERELTARQTLQLQVESKDHLVTSLKSQLEAFGARLGGMDTRGMDTRGMDTRGMDTMTSTKKGSTRDSGLVSSNLNI